MDVSTIIFLLQYQEKFMFIEFFGQDEDPTHYLSHGDK